MSNKTLERLVNLNMSIALVFGIIIKGKIGVIGLTIFFITTCIFAWIYQKRAEPEKKTPLVERVFVIGLVVITFPFCYLAAFKSDSKISDIFMLLFIIWLFVGLIILSIRARRRRKG